MACECPHTSAKTDAARKTLRVALLLNAAMFLIGTVAGVLAQSTGLLADAFDMLTDAIAYGLALMAVSRGLKFKKNAARWSGGVLVLLGAGIISEVVRRWFFGSEPMGLVMMGYYAVSFAVNLCVLMRLAKFRDGGVHIRASYICTRADVLANIAVFISGGLVAATGLQILDLVVGFGIGLYVLKEAGEILGQATGAGERAASGRAL